MAYYERSTTSTTVDGLPDSIRAAVRAQAEASQITVATDAPAFLTRSRRLRNPSLFERLTGIADKDTEHLTAIVLGAKDVLVATYGQRRGMVVLTARLDEVEVGSTADRLAAAIGEVSATVTGFPTTVEGTTGRGSFVSASASPTARKRAPRSKTPCAARSLSRSGRAHPRTRVLIDGPASVANAMSGVFAGEPLKVLSLVVARPLWCGASSTTGRRPRRAALPAEDTIE